MEKIKLNAATRIQQVKASRPEEIEHTLVNELGKAGVHVKNVDVDADKYFVFIQPANSKNFTDPEERKITSVLKNHFGGVKRDDRRDSGNRVGFSYSNRH